jgi:hypothetical protein
MRIFRLAAIRRRGGCCYGAGIVAPVLSQTLPVHTLPDPAESK